MRKPSGYWTKERCLSSANKYRSRRDWMNAEVSAYHTAARHNWLKECCAHMTNPALKWNLTTCKAVAAQFSTLSEWAKNNPSAYNSARRHGWFEHCTAHMARLKREPKTKAEIPHLKLLRAILQVDTTSTVKLQLLKEYIDSVDK